MLKIGNKVKTLVDVDDDIKAGTTGKVIDIIGNIGELIDYEQIEFPVWVQFKNGLTQFSPNELEVIK